MKPALLLDGRFLGGAPTGVRRYVTNLIGELAALRPLDVDIRVICPGGHPLPDGMTREVLPGLSGARPLQFWQQIALPLALRAVKPALLHYSYFDPPWLLPKPFVATCYDLEPLRHPELFRPAVVAYYRLFAQGLRRAERIIAISESTKRDVTGLLGIPGSKVRVIPLAVDDHFRVPAAVEESDSVRLKHRLPSRFVLYVGNTMPHKNLPRLVAAMARVREAVPGVELALAGGEDKYRPTVEAAVTAHGLVDSVRFLGRVEEAELPALYQSASVFAFPSLYEGFGLPVLEAMACGTPVVTSNCSSLPEITGDAAVLVNPCRENEIAQAITGLLQQPERARELGTRGRARARSFSWRSVGEEHLALYRELIG